MAKPVSSTPFKAMEDEAYHAFREWPLFLILRQKELAVHLAATASQPAPSGETNPALAEKRPVKNEDKRA